MMLRAIGRAGCLLAALALATPAVAGPSTVPGTANIYGAGHAVPPDPGGGGAGTLPPVFHFAAAPGQVLTFSLVTGGVSCCNSGWTGPDGGPWASGTTDITSYGGLSGIVDDQHTMFLVGVFLGDDEPADPAPSRLDFCAAALGEDFLSLAPEIGQVFYVGDGLSGTGTGVTQAFFVPATATRLYLGIADALEGGDPSSPPGYYGDNTGQFTAVFDLGPAQVVPASGRSWGRIKQAHR